MNENSISDRQRYAWVMTAMIAPLAAVTAGQSWVTVGIVASLCAALCGTVVNQVTEDKWPKWFMLAQWLWATAALGQMLRFIPKVWPQAEHPEFLVVILLAAALWASRSGAEANARTGTVFTWIVGILMVLVFGAAAKDIRVENITAGLDIPDAEIFFVLMIPGIAVFLPGRSGKRSKGFAAAITFLAVLIPFLTAGVFSRTLAGKMENPFWELSRTLTFSGAAQRFESLVSAGLTISWFLLMSLILCVANRLWPARGGAALCAGGALILYLFDMRISPSILAAGSVLFWGLLPLLAQGIGGRKKL